MPKPRSEIYQDHLSRVALRADQYQHSYALYRKGYKRGFEIHPVEDLMPAGMRLICIADPFPTIGRGVVRLRHRESVEYVKIVDGKVRPL